MAPKAKRSASKSGTPSSEKRARSSPLPEDGREAVVEVIAQLLQKSPLASANSRAAAEALEKSCWEQSGGNQETYQTKCKDIIDKMRSGQHWRVFVSDEEREIMLRAASSGDGRSRLDFSEFSESAYTQLFSSTQTRNKRRLRLRTLRSLWRRDPE